MKFTKEILYEYFITRDLTRRQIAEIFNCDYKTVIRNIRKFGIKKELKDFTTKMFGCWQVIKLSNKNKIKYRNTNSYWLCQCTKCGFKKDILYESLYGKRKSCSNCRYKGYNELTGTYFSNIKRRAKSRNMNFNINIKYIYNLYISQKKRCALSGVPIIIVKKNGRNENYTTASLDRIDSKKGYIKGNVQWVHKDVNKMKFNLDQNKFVQWCNIITNYLKGKDE